MSGLGDTAPAAREGWLVAAGMRLARWGRRRIVRADLARAGLERRADLEERLLLDRELHAYRRELQRAAALERLYRSGIT